MEQTPVRALRVLECLAREFPVRAYGGDPEDSFALRIRVSSPTRSLSVWEIESFIIAGLGSLSGLRVTETPYGAQPGSFESILVYVFRRD